MEQFINAFTGGLASDAFFMVFLFCGHWVRWLIYVAKVCILVVSKETFHVTLNMSAPTGR